MSCFAIKIYFKMVYTCEFYMHFRMKYEYLIFAHVRSCM